MAPSLDGCVSGAAWLAWGMQAVSASGSIAASRWISRWVIAGLCSP
ncbi:MAG: hypothetical protein QOE37_1116 [Microbacteriaceae bacterium]|nr:hypothetical protein [Microbacteriaceae bacterium]